MITGKDSRHLTGVRSVRQTNGTCDHKGILCLFTTQGTLQMNEGGGTRQTYRHLAVLVGILSWYGKNESTWYLLYARAAMANAGTEYPVPYSIPNT